MLVVLARGNSYAACMKKVTVIAAIALALVATGGPAVAGEVNGNGKELPLKGASICKYSGLNDEMTEEEPTRTQSYGTFLALIMKTYGVSAQEAKMMLPSPGDACNPTRGFSEH
jgi:hypothetical protein